MSKMCSLKRRASLSFFFMHGLISPLLSPSLPHFLWIMLQPRIRLVKRSRLISRLVSQWLCAERSSNVPPKAQNMKRRRRRKRPKMSRLSERVVIRYYTTSSTDTSSSRARGRQKTEKEMTRDGERNGEGRVARGDEMRL